MKNRDQRPITSIVWILLLSFSACSGPRGFVANPSEASDTPEGPIRHSDYEDFDASPYRELPPSVQSDVNHDVPTSLMEGRADEGLMTEVQGFRVQIYSTINKSAAFNQEEQAKAWWRSRDRDAAVKEIFIDQLPVYTVYIQPYYRVRVGNFTTRVEAERARSVLSIRYADAFIVPDTVTITR